VVSTDKKSIKTFEKHKIDHTILKKLLQELSVYLQNRDMQANKQFEQIQVHMDGNNVFKEQLDKIERCIDNFDFSQAMKLVKQLDQMLQSKGPL
jgi:hypothetical protein